MVKAWRELVTIPTYEVGKPEKNPMFLEKRVYQGSSGVVYPYPVIESISDVKVDKTYKAVWLENEYILVMVLPELGGRVQLAYDKIAKRHFVYYNHVIKPALVGLAGPWISGGIEFNWPQHHRPTTFMPADSIIEENEDGSITVWVSEMEKMFHQKGMAGFTLRPGCAYLEIKGRLYNRTDVPQTFLWWANPAVEVNDQYQSVFPPDINAVFDHGKRAVSSFPIATGTYYKMDYSAGVDISNYKNIYVPTSYMGVNSRFNFEGGYENDTQAGMLHVASHHFSSGKKQWTWGNGDFGRAWDRNLTDDVSEELKVKSEESKSGELKVKSEESKSEELKVKSEEFAAAQDGNDFGAEANSSLFTLHSSLKPGFRPYIELMAGVYTENQPDFSWLMPYEEKMFTQYFMPYRELGVVKEASKDLIMNIDEAGAGQVRFKIFATSRQNVRILLTTDDGRVLYDQWQSLSPEAVLTETVGTWGATFDELNLKILKTLYGTERTVMHWHAESDDIRPIPDSAEAALLPGQVKTNEQLFLTGQHLEQYRHATWSPVDYYEEALRRDPDDIRCLNALGLWYIRKCRFAKAEGYLRKAVRLITKRNPNPYDSEPIYNLALALKYQGMKEVSEELRVKSEEFATAQGDNVPDAEANFSIFTLRSSLTDSSLLSEAYELFWKATWSKAWADAGYFEAAKISVAQGRLDDALDELDRSLVFGAHNQKALALKAAVLRKMGRGDSAVKVCRDALATDLFNYSCRYELYLTTGDKKHMDELKELMQGLAKNYDETALDYCAAGLTDEARAIWQIAIEEGATTPMTYYYLFAFCGEDAALAKAEQADSAYCFPNRPEDVIALEAAKNTQRSMVNGQRSMVNGQCSKAPYYLGCLYYAARQYDLAIENWELSARLDPQFPTVWRNLALARFNKQGRQQEALECMERAFSLDNSDARVLMELDQLYKRMQKPHAERLAFLQQYPKLIALRDDLVLEEITLLNQTGSYEEAMQKLDSHQFHPWEGGEGKVSAQYQICRVELAKRLINEELRMKNEEFASATVGTETEKSFIALHPSLQKALTFLNECLEYPHHLGEGKLYGAQENDFYYLLGIAYDMLATEAEANSSLFTIHSSLKAKARQCWEEATKGPQEPAAAMYYNDAKPDKIFYQGLALQRLGRQGEANGRFYKLVNYGKQHIFDKVVMDYFAVSLPDLLIWEDSLDRKNEIHCKYMLALGYFGLGDKVKAVRYLDEVRQLDINHQGIQALQTFVSS